MNKTVKIALLGAAASSIAFGGYVAMRRHQNAEKPVEAPSSPAVITTIERKVEPAEPIVPKAEIIKITNTESDTEHLAG